jgi:hypothetical protein
MCSRHESRKDGHPLGGLQPSRHAFTSHGGQSRIQDWFGAKNCGAELLVLADNLVPGCGDEVPTYFFLRASARSRLRL